MKKTIITVVGKRHRRDYCKGLHVSGRESDQHRRYFTDNCTGVFQYDDDRGYKGMPEAVRRCGR